MWANVKVAMLGTKTAVVSAATKAVTRVVSTVEMTAKWMDDSKASSTAELTVV